MKLADGWHLKAIAEIGKVVTGSTPSTSDPNMYGGDIPFVTPGDLGVRRDIATSERTLSIKGAANARVVPAGSTLVTCIGSTIGKSGFAATALATNHQINAVIPDPSHEPTFVYYQLEALAETFRLLAGTQAVPLLNKSAFSSVKITVPSSKSEQRSIAAILSTWDQAIATTERLLVNSQEQKLLLSQQMLTGKVRLKDFPTSGRKQKTPYGSLPTEWGYRRIGELAVEVSQKLGDEEPYPVLSCTKHKGLVDSLAYFNKQVFSADMSTYKVVPRTCFVYATNHIDEGSIGYQDLYDFGLVSPMYTVFKANDEVDDAYLFALLKTEHYRQIFASATNASVDRRGSLRWKDFRNLHIPLPPIEEQRAIAKVLASAVRELELIQAQLGLLRNEKAALMSQLLTGKRRVKLPDAEAEVQV